MTTKIKELSKKWSTRFEGLTKFSVKPDSIMTKVTIIIGNAVCVILDIIGTVLRVILLAIGVGIAVTAWAIAELINGLLMMLDQLR